MFIAVIFTNQANTVEGQIVVGMDIDLLKLAVEKRIDDSNQLLYNRPETMENLNYDWAHQLYYPMAEELGFAAFHYARIYPVEQYNAVRFTDYALR